MISGTEALENGLMFISGTITAIGSMYKLFVPRGEAEEYRKGIKEKHSHVEKKIDNIEFALSKTVTRETLDDVMSPMKDDLKEIKLLLREKK